MTTVVELLSLERVRLIYADRSQAAVLAVGASHNRGGLDAK